MIRTIFALVAVCTALLATSTSALAAGPSRGYYQCYQTVQTQNAVTGEPDGYGTSFVTSFTLKAHHRFGEYELSVGHRWSPSGRVWARMRSSTRSTDPT